MRYAAAHITHWSLYALMIVLPVTGIVTRFGGSTLADTINDPAHRWSREQVKAVNK